MPYSKEERAEIANIIAAQMGGVGKLRAMVGAYNMLIQDAGLSFRFKGSRKWNFCRVDLTPEDTYTVTFARIGRRRGVLQTLAEQNDPAIYHDQLVPLFERQTGLYLSL